MCIQETKVQCMTDSIARSIGSGRFLGWKAVNAEGASGGIFICWDRRALDMLDWEEGQFTLSCRFRNVEDGNVWVFTGVYGPFLRGEILLGMGVHNQSWARLDSWWQGIDVRGSASYKLATKMKEIKQKLKVWNREVFGKLESNKSAALQQVEFWDREENDRILTMEESELKKEAKENYKKWVIMEETHWRQLSREIWLKEGIETRVSFIVWQVLTADIGSLQLDQISQEEAEFGEAFTEEEIQGALMEMNGDKAPGPDGFTLAFWQSCWENVVLRILGFRPISLLGGLYKLLAKVLANRLKRVVGKVVSNSQNAFVRGRQILDASLMQMKCCRKWALGLSGWGGCGVVYLQLNFSVMVNGVPAGFFPSSKGLRQGDPLSPYLFVMGMEVLDVLIRRAVEGGFLSGCNIRGGSESPLHISHLFFADDTIIFWVLNRAPYMWDGVEERVRRRLALWKRQYISKGGRVTLIKSTLASMPIYQMSIFRMPKMVARRLEKVQRDFLWGGGHMEGKTHLVNWEVVCTDKAKGEVRAGGFGWRPKKAMGAVGVGVWKEIWKESEWCWNNMIFKVGKGNTIRFWTDVWCSETALSIVFLISLLWRFKGTQRLRKCGIKIRTQSCGVKEEGAFRVKEAYNLLVRSDDTGFPSRSIWVTRVPTKVCFFAWEATWGRVLTLDRLQRRGYNFQIAAFCVVVRKKV
ncbi:putative mitochondrial protein [Vitis vinifera]|uniref:Putative mitochondrial protein n=1 Tax=Vitis vinifera TaxID=29760 RepID=A0A438BNR1_VITVI|nr:putative mitochondrial protein [Vitis vinifera]